jgi:hypothetical protein
VRFEHFESNPKTGEKRKQYCWRQRLPNGQLVADWIKGAADAAL